MKKEINISIYYYINDHNKIVIDYEQMEEEYKFKIERLKLEIKSTNKKYR